MNRAAAEGAVNPFPILGYLPSVFQEDQFAARFTAGLDEVSAPAIGVLDCLPAYLDPRTTPSDFLPWLGSWVGLDLRGLPEDRMRALVVAAPSLHSLRGTLTGLRLWLELLTGGTVHVVDGAGVFAGDAAATTPFLEVKIAAPDPAAVSMDAVDRVIAANKPVHVPHAVTVVRRR
ncbi:hypothetical protein UK23_14910 [Lentzea aerocolonigenes]|uniref:Phage tail protein n=1 Tax=Lentzea aerocolonigenes TaxID=68170 RepID=A0A0F0H4K6_LENAE|nr:phage tail protein [Lentzea aerocolonigenes]KJK49252.1 hypothetical protein UK23_14910 [Lentzea aerocolonigenes]